MQVLMKQLSITPLYQDTDVKQLSIFKFQFPNLNKYSVLFRIWNLVFGIWILFIVPPIYAQESLGISISPPLNIIDLGERKSIVLAYTIENSSSQDMDITPQVFFFHADQMTGNPVLEKRQPNFVTIQTPGFTLETPFRLASGEKQQLVLNISPTAPLLRDLTFTFLAKGAPANGSLGGSDASINLTTSVGTNLILRVPVSDTQTPPLTLANFGFPFFIDASFSHKPNFVVKNDALTSHQVHGTLTIRRFGKVIKTQGLFPDTILPESQRQLRVSNPDPGIPNQKIPTLVEFDFQGIPGKYTIEILLSDEEGKYTNYAAQFIVFPYRFTLIALVVIVCLLGVVRFKKLWLDKNSPIGGY